MCRYTVHVHLLVRSLFVIFPESRRLEGYKLPNISRCIADTMIYMYIHCTMIYMYIHCTCTPNAHGLYATCIRYMYVEF